MKFDSSQSKYTTLKIVGSLHWCEVRGSMHQQVRNLGQPSREVLYLLSSIEKFIIHTFGSMKKF